MVMCGWLLRVGDINHCAIWRLFIISKSGDFFAQKATFEEHTHENILIILTDGILWNEAQLKSPFFWVCGSVALQGTHNTLWGNVWGHYWSPRLKNCWYLVFVWARTTTMHIGQSICKLFILLFWWAFFWYVLTVIGAVIDGKNSTSLHR